MSVQAFYMKQMQLGTKVVAAKHTYNVPYLETLAKEAEEQFEKYPGMGSELPPMLQAMAAMAGTTAPLRDYAHKNLSLAYGTLAEAYEKKGSHEKALPLYLKLIDHMRQYCAVNPREPKSQIATTMNNAGLSYKYQGKYDEAIEMYRQALQFCEQENLVDTGVYRTVKDNITHMVGQSAGAVNHGSTRISVRACWNCNKREMQAADGAFTRKLMNCTRCRELKVASPACYCCKKCQEIDWKNRHKEFHQHLKENRKEWKQMNFSANMEEQSSDGDGAAGDYDTLFKNGLKAFDAAELKLAAKLLKKAIKLQPNDCATAHYYLAMVYARCRNYTDAVRQHSKCMQLTENKSDTTNREWWAASATGMFGLMTRCPECAVLEKPDWMKNHGKLKQMASKVIEYDPNHAECWFMQGYVFQQENKRRDAMHCFEKAAQLAESPGASEGYRQWKNDVPKKCPRP